MKKAVSAGKREQYGRSRRLFCFYGLILPFCCNIRVPVLLAAGILLASCAGEEEHVPVPVAEAQAAAQPEAPYRLDRPDARIELPASLREVSGLVHLEGERVAAVQDEEGDLFILDARTGRLLERKRFGKKGDYEDLALVPDGRLFVLRSDGRLFEIQDWQGVDPDVDEHKTGLGKSCDAEGLAYDARRHRLLVSCKEDPGGGLKNRRAVYAYDLRTNELGSAPALTLALDDLHAAVGDGGGPSFSEKAAALFEGGRGAEAFKPAAIAFHPVTGELWMLSSVMKAVAVLRDGNLDRVLPLSEALFPHPEGLTFLPGGDLLISNEGGQGTATLLRFNLQTGHD